MEIERNFTVDPRRSNMVDLFGSQKRAVEPRRRGNKRLLRFCQQQRPTCQPFQSRTGAGIADAFWTRHGIRRSMVYERPAAGGPSLIAARPDARSGNVDSARV